MCNGALHLWLDLLDDSPGISLYLLLSHNPLLYFLLPLASVLRLGQVGLDSCGGHVRPA